MLSLKDIDDIAGEALQDVADGDGLDAGAARLVDLAVKVSVTSLDASAIAEAIAAARASGASTEQIQEIVALVSGLGVHSLMMTAATILASAEDQPPLDAERQALWERHVGDDPYWNDFETHMPGFLDALLRLSPASFSGFFDYCAIPWKTRSVPAITKELAAMACDACPTHRFGPGFRLHLGNAIKLGAGRVAILNALAIAARAPEHSGVF